MEFQPNSPSNSNMGNPKDKEHSDAESMGKAGSHAHPEKPIMPARPAGTSAVKGLLP